MTLWFDTHTHLGDVKFDEDRDRAVQNAFAGGVRYMVEIADGPEEWAKARDLSSRYPDSIWWAAGLHPYYSDQASPAVWSALREFAREPRFVAIGEVGLDYAKSTIPADQQKAAFTQAVDLALEVNKPLVIHCRNAYADLHPILRDRLKGQTGCPGVVHCFSGEAKDAEELLKLGFYLGVDGPVSYPSAKPLREALDTVPLERLVLETDSPYLPPQTHRGQRNEPAYLPLIGHHLADLKKVTPANLADATRQNGFSLFRLKQP